MKVRWLKLWEGGQKFHILAHSYGATYITRCGRWIPFNKAYGVNPKSDTTDLCKRCSVGF